MKYLILFDTRAGKTERLKTNDLMGAIELIKKLLKAKRSGIQLYDMDSKECTAPVLLYDQDKNYKARKIKM